MVWLARDMGGEFEVRVVVQDAELARLRYGCDEYIDKREGSVVTLVSEEPLHLEGALVVAVVGWC